ncbi:MAG: hypothetical protein IH598_07345 [Bacteroidales bacterium]|nr:hypothetical protein [Bacteroidales bacterium]
MKKLIYLAAIIAALVLIVFTFYLQYRTITDFQLGINVLIVLFLTVFGAYGLYAENLFKLLRASGKNENLCVEASYFIQKKGWLGKILLFPFIKIKSSNSVVISFFGAFTWVVILLIIFQAIKKG